MGRYDGGRIAYPRAMGGERLFQTRPGRSLDRRRLVSDRGRRHIDPEGYVKITDRVKDLIKSGGEWISSVDLENALVAHESVKEAAVIAVAHPKWVERPLAVVVLKEGCQVEDAELRDFLARSVLPAGSCPTHSSSSRNCRTPPQGSY